MPTAAVAADGTTPVKKTRRRKKSVASEKYSTSAVQARFEEKGPAAVKPSMAVGERLQSLRSLSGPWWTRR